MPASSTLWMACATSESVRRPSRPSDGSLARSMSREGPVPCRSRAASVSSSSARERELVLGLPDNPMTGVDTSPPQKAIGRDSNRGVAADQVRRYGGAEPLAYLILSHMPTRPTVRSPYNTWGSRGGNTSTWRLASLQRSLDAILRFGNYPFHRES